MSDRNFSRLALIERRRKRKRKIIIRRIFILLLTLCVAVGAVYAVIGVCRLFGGLEYDSGFIPTPFGKNVSKRVEKAQKLEIPDWIDKQIIHKHNTARSGIMLVDIEDIVVHYVGNPNTSAQSNRDYFDNETTTVSSHFIVGLEGEIIQCVPLSERSAASNERNKDTISIEVCHPDETGEFSEETSDSLIKLIAWLCNKFSLDESNVIRHYDITGKICPKFYVENEDEWQNLKSEVKEKINEY